MSMTKILIIDDDEDYRMSARAMLVGSDYEVLEADCGHSGLEKARTDKPDLIVLDLMMESPVEGYSIVQALRYREEYADLKSIPVIMVSSVTDDPASRFPMAGEVDTILPDAYLTKPLDTEKFLACVGRMLGQ